MKLVINNCYGGMSEAHKALRADPEFVKKVEGGYDGEGEEEFNLRGRPFYIGRLEHLVVVEIPDEATDYYIEDYDGVETVVYVVNGKIKTLTVEVYHGK